MVLVLVGHAPPGDLTTKIIYSFHIPLFFALSGLLHNSDRFASLGALLKARSRTLLLPYLAYSAIGYCAWLALWAAKHEPWDPNEVLKPVIGTVLGIRNSSFFHGTLWFVACLLLTEILFHGIHRLLGKKALLAFLMAFPFAAYAFNPMIAMRFFPWSIDCAFIALVFFSFGHLLRELRSNSPQAWLSPWVIVAAAAIWVASVVFGGKVDMYTDRFETPVQFLLGALAGTVLVLRLVPMLPSFRWVGFIGRHSLVYLALHQWFAFNLAHRLIDPILDRADLGIGPSAAVSSIATTLIGLLVLWPVCLAFDRWLPFLVGGGSASRPSVVPDRPAGNA